MDKADWILFGMLGTILVVLLSILVIAALEGDSQTVVVVCHGGC